MLTKQQASLKCKIELVSKILMVFLLVAVSYVLVETIREKYQNAPNKCTETVKDEFGLGLRPI